GAADLGEVGVLAQQAVAGVDRVDVSDFGGGDDGGNVEIAVGCARRSDADGLVGKAHMKRVAIGFAIDRDGAHTKFTTGVDDTQRNLVAVGNQNFTKHGRLAHPNGKQRLAEFDGLAVG